MASLVRLRNIKQALKIEKPDETIKYTISGRVSRIRNYRTKYFIDLIDGSTKNHIQTIVEKSVLKKAQLGSFLSCEGNLVPSIGSKQAIEFKVDKLNFVGPCDPETYPLTQPELASLPKQWYRRYIHLRPRTPHFSSLLRIRSELELGLHMIMKQMDFVKVHTPSITSNDSEATSDLFTVQRTKIGSQASLTQAGASNRQNYAEEDLEEDDEDNYDEPNERFGSNLDDPTTRTQTNDPNGMVIKTGHQSRIISDKFFGKDVFMITSAQLHLESLAAALSRVYCLSKTFRAESSISRYHLSEFLMFEAEESNVTDLGSLMERVESIVKFVAQFCAEISEHREDFIELLESNNNMDIYARLAHKGYIRMSYAEALNTLRNKIKQPFDGDTKYGSDISRKHERALLDYCNNVPIFVTHYPKLLKPFYMKCVPARSVSLSSVNRADNDDDVNREALCFDLIAPFGGEICGGSLREDNLYELEKNLTLHWAKSGNNISHTRSNNSYNSSSSNSNNNNLSPEASNGPEDSRNNEWPERSRNDNRNGYDSDGESQLWSSNKRLDWYVDLRRYGTFPHGGFGIGFERLCQALLGIRNIKDTIAFPRTIGKCPM